MILLEDDFVEVQSFKGSEEQRFLATYSQMLLKIREFLAILFLLLSSKGSKRQRFTGAKVFSHVFTDAFKNS